MQMRAFFSHVAPCGGDENRRPGFDNGRQPGGQLTSLRGSCPKGERSESIPPSPPYSKRSSHANAGFFFACCILRGGNENPRPGFDNRRQHVGQTGSTANGLPVTKTPGAFLNNACVGPEGERPMDGPSNGERSESIPPPLTAIFQMRACTQMRAFFRM